MQDTLYDTVKPDLEELCRVHDVGLELIECSGDLDQLMGRILEEYELRLAALSDDALDRERGPRDEAEAKKLRSLMMFAAQAAALKQRAEVADELRRRGDALERALADEERSRRRLDDVLATLEAGILIADGEGRIENVNHAAASLTGESEAALVGRRLSELLPGIERDGDGELRRADDGQVLLVARRNLPGEADAEVILMSDVTEHDRERRERHRVDKHELLVRVVAVLSHKINNPLTSLMGRAQILMLNKDTDPKVRKAAEVIDESAQRIAGLVRELATVARSGDEEAMQRVLTMEKSHTLESADR